MLLLHSMAADLEKLAASFKERGFRIIGEVVEASAQYAREIGAPEYFSNEESQQVSRSENAVPVAKLAEALTLEKPKKGTITLTPELAQHFNQTIGAELADNIQLLKLRLPDRDSSRYLSAEVKEKVNSVDVRLKQRYHQALNCVARAGLRDVGALRGIDPGQALQFRGVGHTFLGFLITAFKPKTQPEV